ncbi:putative thiosulfate sulfurtransferase [Madurella mycetomatis]|uniref:Thiosulfate sulfurtransferase n=1 Tax=Madurella mycetomatis TaxID=100816 RepID=A0A175WD04_9PEZI|nr:putative thiosulfate sulfurtransferase [Madurella mycetomatis]
MVRSLTNLALALAGLILPAAATKIAAQQLEERTSPPIACMFFGSVVPPWWLNKCSSHLDLVIIDLRSATEYAESHIPGSISLPFEPVSAWSDMGPGDLLLEMPPSADVFATLSSIGASNPNPATKIVLVNGVGVPAFPQAASPRVATTLKYAGISEGRVAVLDGGFPGWAAENLPTTTVVPTPVPRTYTATEDRSFLVNISYVAANLHKQHEGIFLVDGRDEAVYNGSVLEEWADKPGHIPSAVSLPARHIWNSDGSYKSPLQLLAQLRHAVGYGVSRSYGQIIVYCGVGGYASSWYFVLTRILGFDNVVMYDGSAQEWSRHYDMEL